MNIRHSNWLARALIVLACVFASGCAKQEVLYGQLTERQANEMVALLQSSGIAAEKTTRDGAAFSISSAPESFGRAIELLHANGYPRGAFDSVGQVFKKEGFISSPTEERARLTYALTQEMANTLQTIDGVVIARVHLAIPEKDPLSDKPKAASASVFIKYRAGKDLTSQVNQMKALVVNGVEGLPYENVTVALFPAEIGPLLKPAAAASSVNTTLLIVAGVGGVGLLAGGALWGWRQRQTIKPKSLVLVKRGEDDKRAA